MPTIFVSSALGRMDTKGLSFFALVCCMSVVCNIWVNILSYFVHVLIDFNQTLVFIATSKLHMIRRSKVTFKGQSSSEVKLTVRQTENVKLDSFVKLKSNLY